MIIWRDRPLANDHPEDPASCKWSSRGSGLLQMIIRMIRPLANDHPEDIATCKWPSQGTGHLQMIIQRIWPLANDHLEDLASCKWSSGGTGLLQCAFSINNPLFCYIGYQSNQKIFPTEWFNLLRVVEFNKQLIGILYKSLLQYILQREKQLLVVWKTFLDAKRTRGDGLSLIIHFVSIT